MACNKHRLFVRPFAMTYVATLIGPNAFDALKRARAVFANPGQPTALGPDAADLPFEPLDGIDNGKAAETLRRACGDS